MAIKKLIDLFSEAGVRWSDDKCHRMGASLAYYALFSLFPLLMLAVTGLGFFLGDDEATRAKIVQSFANTGAPGAQSLIDQTLANMQTHQTARGISTVVGIVAFVLSASAVFSELDTSLNKIWRCEERPSGTIVQSLLATVRDKAMAMLLVLGAALFLLVSLVASTVLSALTDSARDALPIAWGWTLFEHAISIGFLTFFFAALFRVVPDCHAKWRDVLGGGLLTAIAFTLVKRLLTLYLTTVASYSAYGAVGAVLALLTWIYLVSLLVFYGAEFARVYAERYGSLASPTEERHDERGPVAEQRQEPKHRPEAHLLP
ncbi:YihY/virulence factor BrkB family protein [Pendulispora rubella]|uniref:YihY/virulence factor BrkB family protein n=1 Tax=Pendulispora rubella TaxID=2741070 RepID=A0ABZ2L1H2_9BACT